MHRGGYSESDALSGGIEAEEIIPDQLPEPEQESEEDMATGDKLVNLDDLKVAYDKQQADTNSLKSALEADIDAEETARIAAVATEKTRAQAAESQLQANLNLEIERATQAENRKVNVPQTTPYGTSGQYLKTLGNGQTKWDNPGMPSDQQIENAVDNWLDEHPEAVTTVQDGAITPSKLNIDLLKAYKKSGTAMVYFPSLETGGYSGSSALMVAEGKTVLFDASPTVNKAATLDYYETLYNAGLFTNIDIIVISHYHWDHIQCLADILEEFPHEGCHAYLPMNPDGYYLGSDASTILSQRTSVIQTLTDKGISYTEITQDSTITVADGFCTIELFNSDQDAYNYYKTNSPSTYNNFSMVSLVKTGNIYSMFPGDIQVAAQQYIMSVRDLPRLFLYAVHHHGIQNDDDTSYLDKIEPEWAVISTNHERGLVSAASAFAANYSSQYLGSCGYSSYEFAIQKDAGSIVHGINIERSGWYYSYVKLYVDNEYNGTIHDGTQAHPFTDINEANMFIRGNRNLHYRIYVSARETPYSLLWVRDMVLSVEYIGVATNDANKPVVNGLYAKNVPDISFTNIIFKKGRVTNNIYGIAYIYSSTATFLTCDFIGDGMSQDPSQYGIVDALSKVYVSESSFSQMNCAIFGYLYGEAIAGRNNYENITVVYYLRVLKLTIRHLDTLSGTITYYLYADNVHSYPVDIIVSNDAEDRDAFVTLCAKNGGYVTSTPFSFRGSHGKEMKMVLCGKKIVPVANVYSDEIDLASIDLDTIKESGFYAYSASCTNKPGSTTTGGVLIITKYNSNYMTQIAVPSSFTGTRIFFRRYRNGEWAGWLQIEGVPAT